MILNTGEDNMSRKNI